jgi:glycosyltransferase involved in cell wall biosynthesis
VQFTILMPCLNEAQTLSTCIRKAKGCINRLGLAAEIVVADNGSTDGSVEVATREGARVVHVPSRGYGAALYGGIQASRGRFIIMGDADDSYDFSKLDAFIDELGNGADVVIGNRFRGGLRPGAMPWANRYIGNPVLTAVGRRFFHSPANDFHCGLRGLSRDAFERMNLLTTGMEFASEMVIKATLVGLNIVEVPTTLDRDGRNRPPHLRRWRDGWRHLRFMLLYCPRWLFLYPGAALFAAGSLVIGAILGRSTVYAPFEFEAHAVLLAAIAVLIGFQGIAFNFCARIYALNEGFLPEDPSLERMFRLLKLETGLATGAAFLIVGAIGIAWVTLDWSSTGRWTPDPQRALLWAIPSAAAFCLGGQIIFTSFLLSFIGLRRR